MKYLFALALSAAVAFAQSDFTVVLVPDVHINEGTQYATNVGNWISAHCVPDWNCKAVLGVGDFDGQNTNNTTKLANIENGWTLIYSIVDGLGLPYVNAIGNHDYDSDSPSGRRSTVFDGSHIGYSQVSTKPFFGGYWTGDPNGDKANLYIKFSVGSYKFGAVANGLFPRAAALSWAQSVIGSDLNRQWIYLTHNTQDCSTWTTAGDTWGGNTYGIGSDSQGAAQRDAVIAEPNAIFGFNGHYIGCGSSLFSIHTTVTGTHGNPVTFLRANWQETNPDVVVLLKFRPSIGKIEVSHMETSNNTLLAAFPTFSLDWTPISGDTVTNIHVDTTQTQAAVSYTATTTGACTISVTDMSTEHPNVADLDTTIHGTNANSDLGRTVANGFRFPSVCGDHYCSGAADDVHRTFIVGGHDEMLAYPSGCTPNQGGATGCKYVSSALQVATPHRGVISCNGGADLGHFTFTTANLNMGSYYPEYQIPMPGYGLNGMGYVQPTPDTSNPNFVAISPEHGILFKQLAPWNSALHSTQGPFTFSKVIADANWTNPNNFNTRQVAGTLASTSTANDPLFAAFPIGAQDGGFDTFVSDINLVPFGSSTGHTEIAEFCISLDSGQTCANYTPIDVMFSNAVTGCQPSGTCSADTKPSNSWGNLFSTWGGLYVSGQEDITNVTFGGVSVSGSTVTVTPNAQNNTAGGTTTAIKFPFWLKAGVKFDLTGCATGSITNHDANGHLTVSAVNSYGQLTTQETGNTATGCTYTEYHAGVRVILKNSGTLNVSANMTAYRGHGGQGQSDPERWYANPSGKVTDITTNCDGTTNATPQSGYLVNIPQQYIYLVQDNGQTCKQSNLRDVAGGHFFFSDTTISWLTPNQWIANASNGDTVIATHIPNNYTAMPYGDVSEGTRADNFTYSVFSGSASMHTQIQARGGLVAQVENYLGGVGFNAVIDNGSNPAYLMYRASSNQDAPCLIALADHNNNLLSTVNMIGDYPLNYSGCHFGAQGSAGITIVNGQGNGEPNYFDSTVKLGGPFKAMAIATYKNGTPNKKTLAISAATNASPAVLTSAGHDLAVIANVHGTGLAVCSGATDPQWNGTWYVRPVDNNTFQLYHDDAANNPLNSTTFGAIGAGFTCQVAAGIYAIPISSVGNDGSGNARLTLNLASGGFVARFPSGVFPGSDADPVCFTNTSYCTTTTQYYIKKSCSGCTASQVDVYTDSGLTTHATFAAINALAPNLMAYAETCPDQSSIPLPGPLYTESGWGNGANARVGCVSVEALGHFCSSTPAAGEAAAFPCPEDATKSMVHDYFVGDGVYELRDGTNQETGYLLQHVADPHDTNAYKLTWLRSYGNINGASKTGFGMANVFGVNHGNGYALNGTNIVNQAVAINIANLGTANVAYGISGSGGCGCHCEAAVPSKDPGKITTAYGWQSGCNGGNPDSVNASITDYSLVPPAIPAQNIDPVWQFGFGSIQNTKNSYPSHRQVYPVASEQDMNWKTDQFLNITFSGNGQNFEDGGINLARTLTNVSGNIWDIGVAGSPVGGINIKATPVLAHNLPWWYFQDKSGPGSLLSDPADMGKFCVAWIAGQCVAGSTQGHVYAVMNKVFDPGSCMANSSTNGGACAEPFAIDAGWFAQFIQIPVSTNNYGVRLLTKGWWESPGHYEFYGMTPTPDGRWNLMVPMPWYRNQRYKVYAGGSWFLMKNPPFQLYDSRVRSQYIQVPFVKGGGTSGDTVRASCGYGENADPNLGHCLTYNEQCFSSTAATTSNPFVFASETQNATPCAAGCTVTFPTIPGRVAYCRLYTTNGGNTTAGPVQVIAVP